MRSSLLGCLRRMPKAQLAIKRSRFGCTRRLLHQHLNDMEQPMLEEQTLSRFREKRYYPVRPGQVLNDRYHVITKLGFGAHSTVWLTRDRKTQDYSCVKVFVRDETQSSPVANELKILRHIGKCTNDLTDTSLVRLPNDGFKVDGHSCLAMKPQACSLWYLQNVLPEGKVPRELIMNVVLRLVGCINWLQLECGVVHTGMFACLPQEDDERRLTKMIRDHSTEHHYVRYRSHSFSTSRRRGIG